MNINEIKNKLNDAICELVEETVKRELKHEKIEKIKEEGKPELEPGDICEAWFDEYKDSEIVFFSRYYCGKCKFVSNKGSIGISHYDLEYPNWKLIKKANPKNKIVIARDGNGDLRFYINPRKLIYSNEKWNANIYDQFGWLCNTFLPEIKPGEKIEIEF